MEKKTIFVFKGILFDSENKVLIDNRFPRNDNSSRRKNKEC